MSDPLRVEAVRSGFTESVHLVDVAVVDASGRLVASAGDPDIPLAFRSSAKPLQAAVSREHGFKPRDQRHLAIACASHFGETAHIEAVREILSDAGVGEDQLRCPTDEVGPALAAIFSIHDRGRIFFNCSGKHAAMLAACVASGWPLETYRDADHPLQRAMISHMEDAAGLQMEILIDGCGVPTPVAPLQAFARAFSTIRGTDEAAAMRAHPWFVRGTGGLDSTLMEHLPGAVSKSGAEALQCVVAGEVTLAIKVRDGMARGGAAATMFVLRQLGLLPDQMAEELQQLEHPVVTGGGAPVGELRVVGDLSA